MRIAICLVIIVVLVCLPRSVAQSGQTSCAARQASAQAVAISELRRRAEAGDASAQNALGNIYVNGNLLPRDYKAAASWYVSAAAHGSVNAQFMLGFLFERGWGVPQDDAQAAKYYRSAAAQ